MLKQKNTVTEAENEAMCSSCRSSSTIMPVVSMMVVNGGKVEE